MYRAGLYAYKAFLTVWWNGRPDPAAKITLGMMEGVACEKLSLEPMGRPGKKSCGGGRGRGEGAIRGAENYAGTVVAPVGLGRIVMLAEERGSKIGGGERSLVRRCSLWFGGRGLLY